MTTYKWFSFLSILSITVAISSCSKDYGNLNSPTIEQFLQNASRDELNNLVSGTESGLRNNMSFYLDDVGTIGREGYRFSGSEPRYVTDLLGANDAQLSGSNFYINNPWAARYRVIKNSNVLIEAATNSTLISDAERSGYLGFARMIKAYQLLLNLNLTYSNGIRVDVSNPENLGGVVGYEESLSEISALLDSSKNDFASSSIIFKLAGFTGFNDAEGLTKVNRALAARVNAYRKDWPGVLQALSESFYDPLKNIALGVNHVFANGSGDQLNPMFIPQNQTGEVRVAHPSFEEDIVAGDDRLGKTTVRDAVASLSDLSSDRDVWVYRSSTAPIPIIRNEELILLYAEAKINLTEFTDAVDELNIIRTAHNLPIYSGPQNLNALIDELLYQRRYSLYYEGHRWIDVRRYGKLASLPIDRPNDDVWEEFPLPITEE